MSGPVNTINPSAVKVETKPKESFVSYLGRKISYFIGQFFYGLASLINKVKNVASGVFSKSQPVPAVPTFTATVIKNAPASEKSATASDKSASASESSESDSESSDMDHLPFATWTENDWKLVFTVLRTMVDQWSNQCPTEDKIPDELKIELRNFGLFKEKFDRVYDRMPEKQKKVGSVHEFFKFYKKFTESSNNQKTWFEYAMSLFKKTKETPAQKNSSPRKLAGGIPQVGNSCYLNAIVQAFNPKHLNQLGFSLSDNTKQLDHALHLLMRLKDDPDADADEIWFAALVLRNLLFDTGVVDDLRLKNGMGYFIQQDAAACANGLLGGNKINLGTVFKIDKQEELIPDFHPKTEAAVIKLTLETDETRNFQQLIDKRFALEQGPVKRSFTRIKTEDGFRIEQWHEDSDEEVDVAGDDYQQQELICLQKDEKDEAILPKFLCFSLGRFCNDPVAKTYWKNNSVIDFPKDGIVDLSKTFDHTAEKPVLYKLTGVVLHEGDVNGGHYTTYATRDKGVNWRLYNDEIVGDELTNNGNIPDMVSKQISANGYLFYLEKVEDKSVNLTDSIDSNDTKVTDSEDPESSDTNDDSGDTSD